MMLLLSSLAIAQHYALRLTTIIDTANCERWWSCMLRQKLSTLLCFKSDAPTTVCLHNVFKINGLITQRCNHNCYDILYYIRGMQTNQIAAFLKDGPGNLHMQAELKVRSIWPLHIILIPLGKTNTIWKSRLPGPHHSAPPSLWFPEMLITYIWIPHSGIVMHSRCMARVFPYITFPPTSATLNKMYSTWIEFL